MTSAPSTAAQPHPGAVAAEPAPSPFARLDEVLLDPQACGVIDIDAAPEALAPIARHAERRARQLGRSCVSPLCTTTAEVWRDVAHSLGIADNDEPHAFATCLVRKAHGHVLAVAGARATAWGRAVCDELALLAINADNELLFISLSAHPHRCGAGHPGTPSDGLFFATRFAARGAGQPLPGQDAQALRLRLTIGELCLDDDRRWWDAIVAADAFVAGAPRTEIDRLDRWWQQVRARGLDPAPASAAHYRLAASDVELLALLVRAGVALDEPQLACLGAASPACDRLVASGLVTRDAAGRCRADNDALCFVAIADPSARDQALAELLQATAGDAWTMMRAAELWAAAAMADRAQTCAFSALAMVTEKTARADFWQRWSDCLDELRGDEVSGGSLTGPAGERLNRLIAAAEHALTLGDSDRADSLSASALHCDGNRFDVLLIRGRALSARGDLTGATLALRKAAARASDAGERARADAELAETRYLAGDHLQAERCAADALAAASDQATRLAARNVLGKLLILREAWDEAEAHFAADALDAAAERLPEAELRAQLNRAVSMLWARRFEESGRIFSEVYEQGQHSGNKRAMAYALSNLATVAILEHRYADALVLCERAIAVRRQMGEHLLLVLPVANLAELRLRLGMCDEAEQALRFGIHACGDSLPVSRRAYFAMTAAQIHLERGDTALCARELTTARCGASSAGDSSLLGQIERIAARVALADGDVAGVKSALSAAGICRHTARGKADVALIEAMLARALGDDYLALAEHAVVAAQQADDSELLQQAYWLRAQAHAGRGEMSLSEASRRRALEYRDRVVSALPAALRERYLARPVVAALQGADETPASAPLPELCPPHSETSRRQPPRRLVGESPAMRALYATIQRVAAANATVLIHGPTGTGKELVAEAIHQQSLRRHGPLVKVNCAALVETLLLSELFGHEKGAFTGASTRRRGRFEMAEGGTLFLDEIGDISPRTQIALLRVLQDGTFERVGGCTSLRGDVRIVCATHRDLRAMVERGELREDLYYRLCGITIEVPALKDRLSDLPALCSALLERAGATLFAAAPDGAAVSGIAVRALAPEALRALGRHGWPGNVRELENSLRVAALFAKGPSIELADFTDNVESLSYLEDCVSSRRSAGSIPPPPLRGALTGTDVPSDEHRTEPPHPVSSDVSSDVFYAEIRGGIGLSNMKKRLEHECIARALCESGGNITRAAQLLGMKRPRLSQLVKEYNLATMLEDIKS